MNATTRAAMNDAVIRRGVSWRRERNMALFVLFMLCVIVGAANGLRDVAAKAAVVTTAARPKPAPRAAAPVVDFVRYQAPCPVRAQVNGQWVVWACPNGDLFQTRLK